MFNIGSSICKVSVDSLDRLTSPLCQSQSMLWNINYSYRLCNFSSLHVYQITSQTVSQILIVLCIEHGTQHSKADIHMTTVYVCVGEWDKWVLGSLTLPNFCANVPVSREWKMMIVSSRSHKNMRLGNNTESYQFHTLQLTSLMNDIYLSPFKSRMHTA